MADLAFSEATADAYNAARAREDIECRAYALVKGAIVYVTRGRKAKGRSGVAFWIGHNGYGYSVGIKDWITEEVFFTASQNVDVVAPLDLD